jgi:hypothetical protein
VPWAATGMARVKINAIVTVVIARFILYS